MDDKISVTSDENDSDEKFIIVKDLQPGYSYTSRFTATDELIEVDSETINFVIPTVMTCTGDESDDGSTGRLIVQQDGYVMFELKENSMCEESFSITCRTNKVDEFLTEFSLDAESFTINYLFSSSVPYGIVI